MGKVGNHFYKNLQNLQSLIILTLVTWPYWLNSSLSACSLTLKLMLLTKIFITDYLLNIQLTWF